MVWSVISEHWTNKLSIKASTMPNLQLLRSTSLPLGLRPHPIFTTCQTPPQVRISIIQAKMLSGIYRSCYHSRHWQHNTGVCLLPDCGHYPGDLLHLFKSCLYLTPTVKEHTVKANEFLSTYPFLMSLFSRKLAHPSISSLQFLPDHSTDDEVLQFPPNFKNVVIPLLFHASWTLIWPVHRARLRVLGLIRYL